MPDRRRHRGPHPEDATLFADERIRSLRTATLELSWLLTRGYAPTSAVALVGNRHALDARQRRAVLRAAAPDEAVAGRLRSRVDARALRDRDLWVDGYNALTTIEAALAGAVVLVGRDGSYRDMASMHGSYRRVTETMPAIRHVGECLAPLRAKKVRWLLDRPVSNSGRLKTMIQETAEREGWPWTVDLVPDPDALLERSDEIVASSDSRILDRARHWFDLPRFVIESRVSEAWIVDLSD